MFPKQTKQILVTDTPTSWGNPPESYHKGELANRQRKTAHLFGMGSPYRYFTGVMRAYSGTVVQKQPVE